MRAILGIDHLVNNKLKGLITKLRQPLAVGENRRRPRKILKVNVFGAGLPDNPGSVNSRPRTLCKVLPCGNNPHLGGRKPVGLIQDDRIEMNVPLSSLFCSLGKGYALVAVYHVKPAVQSPVKNDLPGLQGVPSLHVS